MDSMFEASTERRPPIDPRIRVLVREKWRRRIHRRKHLEFRRAGEHEMLLAVEPSSLQRPFSALRNDQSRLSASVTG
jgi:hypothetical protein